jgi:hypothetical protein
MVSCLSVIVLYHGLCLLLAISDTSVAATTSIVKKLVQTIMDLPRAGSREMSFPKMLATSLTLCRGDIQKVFNSFLIRSKFGFGTSTVSVAVSIVKPKYSFLCEDDPKKSDFYLEITNPAFSNVRIVVA